MPPHIKQHYKDSPRRSDHLGRGLNAKASGVCIFALSKSLRSENSLGREKLLHVAGHSCRRQFTFLLAEQLYRLSRHILQPVPQSCSILDELNVHLSLLVTQHNPMFRHLQGKISPRHWGMKEGRQPIPSFRLHKCLKRAVRLFGRAVIAATLILLTLVYFISSLPTHLTIQPQLRHHRGTPRALDPSEETTVVRSLTTSEILTTGPDLHSHRELGNNELPVLSTPSPKRMGLEHALGRVIDLLPDETEYRYLLRPVEGTGAEGLHELGLRVRKYKRLFDAWEELHVVRNKDGSTFVRDDVIQHLYQGYYDSSSEEITKTELANTIHSYEDYRSLLVRFGKLLFPWITPYFADQMTLHSHFKQGGRGIVFAAGDKQASFLKTAITTLRELGCTLPIEIMYLGDSDLSEDNRADLEALSGVITRDINRMVNTKGWKLAGWAAKPFAILFSSFREALLIDADALFFRSPEILFDESAYKKTGALFFRDRSLLPESRRHWLQQLLPKPISAQARQSPFWTGHSSHVQESGVVLVDKWRHFIALLVVTRMNGPDRDGDRSKGRVGVYDMVFGKSAWCMPVFRTYL